MRPSDRPRPKMLALADASSRISSEPFGSRPGSGAGGSPTPEQLRQLYRELVSTFTDRQLEQAIAAMCGGGGQQQQCHNRLANVLGEGCPHFDDTNKIGVIKCQAGTFGAAVMQRRCSSSPFAFIANAKSFAS